MIEKSKCIPGQIVIVNNKITKWNVELGMTNNGLCSITDTMLGQTNTQELLPGTKLRIVNGPKRRNYTTLIEYNVLGQSYNRFSYWISFKHKVDII